MARYIDADILAKIVFDKWQECDELKHIIPAIRNAVMCATTADVVEAVRCKDCIHYWKNWKNDEPDDECAVCLASPKDDAFCSEGEGRKDDGAKTG